MASDDKCAVCAVLIITPIFTSVSFGTDNRQRRTNTITAHHTLVKATSGNTRGRINKSEINSGIAKVVDVLLLVLVAAGSGSLYNDLIVVAQFLNTVFRWRCC